LQKLQEGKEFLKGNLVEWAWVIGFEMRELQNVPISNL
jgi:hypothetical protein